MQSHWKQGTPVPPLKFASACEVTGKDIAVHPYDVLVKSG